MDLRLCARDGRACDLHVVGLGASDGEGGSAHTVAADAHLPAARVQKVPAWVGGWLVLNTQASTCDTSGEALLMRGSRGVQGARLESSEPSLCLTISSGTAYSSAASTHCVAQQSILFQWEVRIGAKNAFYTIFWWTTPSSHLGTE